MLIKEIVNYLENRFPKENAEEFDLQRIGLIIGSPTLEVTNVLLTLDLTEEVLDEAIANNCNLIISHHPYLFNPLFNISFDDEKGRVIEKMFKHKISLYSMHTNLDVGAKGVNDCLAKILCLENVKVINDIIAKGNYLRYGNVKKQTVKEFATHIKNVFNLSGVRITLPDKQIETVGIVGGSGAHISDIKNAIANGCECYITGEVKLNVAIEAKELGLALIEVNHGIEKYVFYQLKEEMIADLNINTIVSTISTDPLIFC